LRVQGVELNVVQLYWVESIKVTDEVKINQADFSIPY